MGESLPTDYFVITYQYQDNSTKQYETILPIDGEAFPKALWSTIDDCHYLFDTLFNTLTNFYPSLPMIIEAGIVLGLYASFRMREKSKSGGKGRLVPKQSLEQTVKEFSEAKKVNHNSHGLNSSTSNRPPDSCSTDVPEKTLSITSEEETANHYIKVSAVHLGLATIRQFLYPPVAPIYLGVYAYNSYSLYRRAERSLVKEKRVGLDVLVSMSSVLGLAIGQYFAMGLGCLFYFVGDKFIIASQRNSKTLLTESFGVLPKTVWILRNGSEIGVSLEEVSRDDIIVVKMGEMIPVDGEITGGSALVDQHRLTGEHQPAEKNKGDKVFAATLVIAGSLHIKTQQTGEDTTIAEIEKIVSNTICYKSKIQLKGENWSEKGTLPFLALFMVTTPILGAKAGLVVLGSHFGGKIRVLAPLATVEHMKTALDLGILVKEGGALESLNEIDTILFDKTGTLTLNALSVVGVNAYGDYGEKELITYAAAAQCKLTHPISIAIVEHAKKLNLSIPETDNAVYQIGSGTSILIDGQLIKLGSRRFFESENINLNGSVLDDLAEISEAGNSLVLVAINDEVVGSIELRSEIRGDIQQTLNELKNTSIEHTAIVSGDHEAATRKIANELGVHDYFHSVLPMEKADIVAQLQAQGRRVCFIGDGINDLVAMQKAEVSISLSGASSIATDVADIIMMDGSLDNLDKLFGISSDLNRNLKTSLGFTVLPAVINLSGILLADIGYTTALVVKNTSFLFGLGNASRFFQKLDLQVPSPQKQTRKQTGEQVTKQTKKLQITDNQSI